MAIPKCKQRSETDAAHVSTVKQAPDHCIPQATQTPKSDCTWKIRPKKPPGLTHQASQSGRHRTWPGRQGARSRMSRAAREEEGFGKFSLPPLLPLPPPRQGGNRGRHLSAELIESAHPRPCPESTRQPHPPPCSAPPPPSASRQRP